MMKPRLSPLQVTIVTLLLGVFAIVVVLFFQEVEKLKAVRASCAARGMVLDGTIEGARFCVTPDGDYYWP